MIAYLEGRLFKKEEDRILILVQQVGYEVFLPSLVLDTLVDHGPGASLALYIYYYQTDRQPKPVLIGFSTEEEKDFFQLFLTVEDIGPIKAAKALTLPVREISRMIESGDVTGLSGLKGIGKRTAQKIVATLAGKTARFMGGAVNLNQESPDPAHRYGDVIPIVMDVLTLQMGHRSSEAEKLIHGALLRKPDIQTPEALLEEIYRGWKPGGVQ